MCLWAWKKLEAVSPSFLNWISAHSSGRPMQLSALMRLATWGAIETQPGLFCGEAMVTFLPNPEVMLLIVVWELSSTFTGHLGLQEAHLVGQGLMAVPSRRDLGTRSLAMWTTSVGPVFPGSRPTRTGPDVLGLGLQPFPGR